jgi:PAS domain S-box-containing protein
VNATPCARPIESEAQDARMRRALLHMLEDLQRDRDELRRARQSWMETFDAVGDPMMVHDAELRVVRCNRAYAARAGLDFGQIVGRPYWECFPKGSGPLAGCRLPIEPGACGQQETEIRILTGEIFISRAFALDDGHDSHVLHLFKNVTEERTVQQALRASEQKLRAIFDHSRDGLLAVDVGTRLVSFANPSMERMLGYGSGDLVGMPVIELPAREALADVMDRFERGVRGELDMSGDMPLRGKDGRTVYVDVSGGPVELEGRLHLLGAFRDTTERRERDTKLREQLDELMRWQALSLGKEDRVIALKREVNELLAQSQQPPRYPSAQ